MNKLLRLPYNKSCTNLCAKSKLYTTIVRRCNATTYGEAISVLFLTDLLKNDFFDILSKPPCMRRHFVKLKFDIFFPRPGVSLYTKSQDTMNGVPLAPLPAQNTTPNKWPHRLLILALLLSVVLPLVTGSLLSWHSLGELDVWLHQKSGQDILSTHSVAHLNSFSFTEPDHPWINHEWLFQVLVAVTGPSQDRLAAGIDHWILLRSVLSLILLMVLLIGDKPWRAPPLISITLAPGIILGVLLLWPRLLLRPELVSYTFLVLIVRLAEFPGRQPWNIRSLPSVRSRETLAALVTLFWAQFHGFSAMAPLIWLIAGILRYLPGGETKPLPLRRLLTGTALITCALIVTPNGWQGLIYPFLALGQFSSGATDLQGVISELQPLLQTVDGLHLTIIVFKISLIWGAALVILTWPRRNLLRIVLWLAAAAATVFAQRNLGIYALTFILLQTSTRHFSIDWLMRGKRTLRNPALVAALPALLTIIATIWFWSGLVNDGFYLKEGQSRRFGSGTTVARYPFAAADILASQPGSRVFSNVDAAALTLSWGKAQVYIDGRTEAYSPELWNSYQKMKLAGPDALAILQRTRASHVLLAISGKTFHPLLHTLLESDQWDVVQADIAGVLFARSANLSGNRNREKFAELAQLQIKNPASTISAVRQADLLVAQASLLGLAHLNELSESRLRLGLKSAPRHPRLNHNLGNILMQKGQIRPALSHFQTALKTNPRLTGSALNAGVCQMKTGDFSGAEKMFRTVTQLQPENFQGWVNRSLALQQLGRQTDAYDSMKKAVLLNPGNPRLQTALQDLKPRR